MPNEIAWDLRKGYPSDEEIDLLKESILRLLAVAHRGASKHALSMALLRAVREIEEDKES